ncbi:MAG TPA: T9SS type A sorting domain-containing protein [Chitinophagaceae bacterium]
MTKFYPAGIIRLFILALIVGFFSIASVQTTLTTQGSGSLVYNSASADGAIVFGVKNTNGYAVILTDVSNYLPSGLTGASMSLWYHTTVTGAPGAINTTNGWTSVATAAVNTSSAGVTPIFQGLNMVIPANTTYRFAISGPPYTPYYAAANSNPNFYRLGGVEIYTQDNVNSPGYGGAFPGPPANTPRGFLGSITFKPEIAALANNAAAFAIVSPSYSVCRGNSDVKVKIVNTGNNIINNVQVNWELDGVAQTPVSYSTPLDIAGSAGGNEAVVTLANVNFNAVARTIKVWTSLPNGVADAFAGDDTTSTTIYPLMSGSYTVGGVGADFPTLTSAVAALAPYGICGPVVFNVTNGTYNERFTIPVIHGASPANTVTFNGNGSTISFSSSGSADRNGVVLNGADYVTLDNFIIDGSAGTYAWGITLIGGADRNTISNCTINLSTSSTTSTYHAGIVVSGSLTSTSTSGNNGNNNSFINNTINGGYSGIILYGNSSAGAQNTGNKVIKNVIKNAYAYSVYLGYQSGVLVDSNDISRPNRTGYSGGAGVYMTTGNVNSTVSRNRIHNMFDAATTSTSTFYGFYVSSDGAAGQENKLINNLVYNTGGNGTVYGIYNTTAPYMVAYHNTIVLNDQAATSGTAYGFYQTGATTGLQFKNNIVFISRSGTGIKRCIFLSSATTSLESNNNVLYIGAAGGTDNKIGAITTSNTYATLADWQTANSGAYDQSSYSVDPLFTNPTANPADFTPTETAINGKGANVGVSVDILGNPRIIAAPDPGAYEYLNASCTAPPTAGTATVAPSAVACGGSSIQLALSGNVAEAGLIYRWQRATVSGGPFTDITSDLNAPDYTAVMPAATASDVIYYYRASVSCGASVAYSTEIAVTVPGLFPAGTYTINPSLPAGGTNYQSFNAAVDAIRCGIGGAVVFNVDGASNFNEQVIIPAITGTSASNTITFKGNGAALSYTSTSTSERAVIKLNGADYVTIDSLNITAGGSTSGEYGYGVQMVNDADNNTVSGCTINVAVTPATASSTSFAGVVINASTATTATGTGDSKCDNNTITRNTINGGYLGIGVIANSSTNTVTGNKIKGNTITNFYTYGVYLNGNISTLVDSNDVSRPARATVSSYYGVYMTGVSRSTVISRNRFHNPFGAVTTSTDGAYGVNSSSVDATPGNENIIANNLIYGFNGEGTQNAFLNTGSDNTWYFFNSISLDDASATTATTLTRGLYQNTAATGLQFKNNIVKISRGGTGDKQCIFLNTAGTVIASSNNDLYMSSTGGAVNAVGNINATNYTTLAAWQSASALDANSQSLDPLFTDPSMGDLSPTEYALDNLGTPVSITTDLTGALRNATTPDMGAYEFTAPVCTTPPAAGSATSSASAAVCSGSAVVLGVTGNSSGIGQTYVWQSATTVAGTYTDISASSALPGLSINPTESRFYRVAVTCSGNTSYSVPVEVLVNQPLAGVYTIDGSMPTGGANYQSFNDAVSAMLCGVSAPVVFNVAPGTYNEQVVIPAITGASATNTITFKGNLATLSFNSSTSTSRTGIILNGADYITIDSLMIDGSAGTYGWGVLMTNNANNNMVSNCVITVSKTSTSSAYHIPVVFSGSVSSHSTSGANANNNTITGNTLSGGYYGIVLYGGSTTGAQNVNNTVSKNIIQEFYTSAVYAVYQSGTVIDSNDISRPTRTTMPTTTETIYMGSDCNNMLVNGNRIHNMFDGDATTSDAIRGISISTDATVSQRITVQNNAIYNINNGAGAIYGIYNSGSSYCDIYHNTIDLADGAATAGSTYGFYQTTTASDINFKNNIITITRGGSGTKYAIYKSTSANLIISNNNVFYLNSSGSGTQNVGYQGGAQSTLASWQSVSGQDANSIVIDPMYLNAPAGDFTPTEPLINNLGANVGVAFDILDSVRNVSNPDPGAFEFNLPGCSNPPTAGTAASSLPVVCSGESFTLDITGSSSGNGLTFQWQSSPDNTTWTNVGTAATVTAANVSQTASSYYRAQVVCSGGTAVYTNTVYVSTPTTVLNGIYTINSAVPTGGTNFSSFNDAVLNMKCGIGGPVVFNVVPGSGPYNEQVIIPQIPGTSAVNTITFNGNGETLSYTSPVGGERAIFKLNGTDYVTIDSLRLFSAAAASAEYAYGVQLVNDADNNIIRKCTIELNTTATSSNFAGIVINSATSTTATTNGDSKCDNNLISGNLINGGYYGVVIASDGGNGLMVNNNQVVNNTISNFHLYGVYLNGGVNTTIEQNDISRPGRSTVSTFYGVYLTEKSTGTRIIRNRIHNTSDAASTSTSGNYAVYLTNCDATAGSENIVANNMIYRFNNAGSQYALYNSGSDYVRYVYNSVLLDGPATSSASYDTRGFYQTTAASGIELKNNIIIISRPCVGDNHCLYFNTSTTTFVSDYNDLQMLTTAGSLNNVAYINSTQYPTLAAWQAASGTPDVHSLSVDPLFVSADDLHLQNGSGVSNQGTAISGISTDIDGDTRSATTPDIGADEFAGPLPVTLVSFTGELAGVGNRLRWITATESGNKGFELQRSVNGQQFSTIGFIASKAENGNSTTIQDYVYVDSKPFEGSTYYRLKQIDNEGKVTYSNVVVLSRKTAVITLGSVYPNPASNELNIRVNAPAAQQAIAVITDLAGKVISRQSLSLAGGTTSHRMNISQLAAGNYFIRLVCGNGCETTVQRFVKQ